MRILFAMRCVRACDSRAPHTIRRTASVAQQRRRLCAFLWLSGWRTMTPADAAIARQFRTINRAAAGPALRFRQRQRSRLNRWRICAGASVGIGWLRGAFEQLVNKRPTTPARPGSIGRAGWLAVECKAHAPLSASAVARLGNASRRDGRRSPRRSQVESTQRAHPVA